MVYLIPIICLVLFVAWLAAEFKASRRTRVTLGIVSLAACSLIAGFVGALQLLNYNAYFGQAAEDLVSATISRLETGDTNRVLQVLRGLKAQYHPTYENRADFRELAKEAAAQLEKSDPIQVGSAWAGSPYDQATWKGHWEDDSGYWIVINDLRSPFDVLRSGDPPTRMHDVSVSHDLRVLRFKEGSNWLHTLTLTNKHEAVHEWFDLEKQAVWQVDRLHKLVRAVETDQATPAN